MFWKCGFGGSYGWILRSADSTGLNGWTSGKRDAGANGKINAEDTEKRKLDAVGREDHGER